MLNEEMKRRLETIFLACAVIVTLFVMIWLVLGTVIMQLLTVSALVTGVFLLGSWWNDHVQQKERDSSIRLLSTVVPLLIESSRGDTRKETKMIEAKAITDAAMQEEKFDIQEYE